MTASAAKQNFGDLLAAAAHHPVTIERHGKAVAIVGPPGLLEAGDPRRAARAQQREVEMRRLLKHHQVALALATGSATQRRKLLASAHQVVERWESERLCSLEYVTRWRQWLSLPVQALAAAMTSTEDPWASAMRQNSPFHALPPAAKGSS